MIYDSHDFLSQSLPPITEVVHSPPPAAKKSLPAWLQILQWQFLAAVFLGTMVFSLKYCWPQGYEAARAQFVCQELGPIQKASHTLVGQVLKGQSVPEALAAFCSTVLEGIGSDDKIQS